MAIEIERKFLVTSEAWRSQAHERTLLRQGYLANTARASVRVRIADARAWVSIKAMTPGRARSEYEYAIAAADAGEMLERLCEGPLIEKWRHNVSYQHKQWEIDEFLGDNAGLVIAELELAAEDESFERPPWLGAEVTDEERYYNFRLSQHPYRRWPENLRPAL